MNKYVLYIGLLFIGCSPKNYIEIQQENLPIKIEFYTSNEGGMNFYKRIKIKNNSFRFMSLKMKYIEGFHTAFFNWALKLEENKKKYTAFENSIIKLYPYQDKEIFYHLLLYVNIEDDKQRALTPLFIENYDSIKGIDEEQKIEVDYHKFKKEYSTVMEYLLQGYDTIEVKVLKPKEEVLHFKNEW